MASTHNYETHYGNDETDDLEKALVLAAADADARNSTCSDEYYKEYNSKTEQSDNEDDKNLENIVDKSIEHTARYDTKKDTNHHIEYDQIPKSYRNYDEKADVNYDTKKSNYDIKNDPDSVNYQDTVIRSSSGARRKISETNEQWNKINRIDESQSGNFTESIQGHAKVVAKHYNTLEEKGLNERAMSRIFFMRNFHNWIKSMLINEYLKKIKMNKKHNAPIRVHDMCCGKGGDLLKWRKGNINHLICSDIASVSLEQCKARYEDMKTRNFRDRNPMNLYTIEYIVADCTRIRLREKYKDPSMKLDLVSCQFAYHYSFESLSQAECMLKNAGECLEPGGFFIGTMPDANELIARVQKSGGNSFGNNVYNVSFECDTDKPPLFGAKYNFHLDGCVDCPEFLVHFPTFIKLAKKYGLKFIRKEKFHEFYERMKDEGLYLLSNMKSLEPFPAQDVNGLVGTDPDDYVHAEEYEKKYHVRSPIGTLSKSEWEASSLYLTFVFEKVKNTWNEKGEPVYDI